MIKISTGPLSPSSFNPSCSCKAVKMEGPEFSAVEHSRAAVSWQAFHSSGSLVRRPFEIEIIDTLESRLVDDCSAQLLRQLGSESRHGDLLAGKLAAPHPHLDAGTASLWTCGIGCARRSGPRPRMRSRDRNRHNLVSLHFWPILSHDQRIGRQLPGLTMELELERSVSSARSIARV